MKISSWEASMKKKKKIGNTQNRIAIIAPVSSSSLGS